MNVSIYNLKRIGIGLLAMTVTSICLAFLPSVFPFTLTDDQFFLSQPLPTVEQSIKVALAAFVGAYAARVPFVVATIVYYAGISGYVFYVLTLIAEPVDPVSVIEIAARNAFGAGFGLIAAVVGADLGSRLRISLSGSLAEAN